MKCTFYNSIKMTPLLYVDVLLHCAVYTGDGA